MANKYKYVCTVFTLFGTAPACVRGSGQRISCMSGTRYRSPDSRPSAGVSRARGRAGCWRIRVGRRCPGLSGLPGSEARPRPCGLLANQGGAAVFRSAGSAGSAGSGGSPAAVRVVGKSGWGGGVPVCRTCRGRRLARGRAGCWRIRKGGVPVCRKPGARVCLSGSRGGQSDADTGVGRPESGGADECRVAFGRMPGLPGYAWVSQPNRAVGLPERGACCGYGRSAVLARKNEGSPERLPSPSKINP